MYFSTGAQLQAALNALPDSKTGNYVAFDSFYYGETYMGSYAGTLSPIDHFVQIGAARGYQPNADFDPAFYANQYADLTGKGYDSADLIYHFMLYGLDEGRAQSETYLNFDGAAYLANNSDVQAYVDANLAQFGGSELNGAIAHYVKFGESEGRDFPASQSHLTVNADTLEGNTFFSVPEYTPGGNDFVNTLQDEDVLTGTGDINTLNVTLGSVNDSAESMVTPTLNNIQVVNVEVTAGSDDPSGINFQDSDGLETLNVERVTATNADINFIDLDATTANIGLANATRDGNVEFEWREDVLTSDDDVLNVTLNNVRLNDLDFWEGGDSSEDEGYFFETVNVAVTGVTNLDEIDITGNWEESTSQTINFTVDADLEINDMEADGASFINIEANDHVMIGEDEDGILSYYNDGISTNWLESMVVTGDSLVEIDGLDGSDSGYTFDASALEAAVHLGMQEAADGVVAISGLGDDMIYAYESMGADVTTNDGDDEVVITSDGDGYGDQENTSQISTGNGDDMVAVSGDMLAENDEDSESNELGDVEHASIDTGAGNDEVYVGDLESERDWDHNVLNDGNADDLWTMSAATISTGAGDDMVEAGYLGENAIIDTGADNDEVTIDADTSSLSGGVVLGEDTDDAREVTLAGVEDTLGAVIDLGAGDDILTFNNESDGNYGVLLVGERAEVRGGAGTDELNVNFVDSTEVVYAAAAGDDADFITGIETINLTALNAVDSQTSALTGEARNENVDTVMPTATLDVARVDTDLATINLVSEEDALLANPADELFEPGVETGFVLDNLRSDIVVNLTAQEAGTSQGDSNSGATFLYPVIGDDNDEDFDVELTVDYEDATAQDDTFTLNVTAASGEFDLDLYVEDDGDGISGTGTDSDNEIENVVLNFADVGSHRIDMNGFGDNQHSEAQDAVDTSLTINSAAAAGEVFTVTNVSANDISIVVDADVRLALDAVLNDWNYDQFDLSMDYDMNTSGYYFNTYNIETGAGDDWVDMTTDMVDGDDTIDLGAGRNELVIANDVIINDVLNSDEIFENIRGVQILTLAGDTWDGVHENAGTFGSNGEIDIALMDDALATGIDTIQLVALEDENGDTNDAEVNLLIDTEFTRDLTVNIDSRRTGAEFNVDNVAGVALDIYAAVDEGIQTELFFGDSGLPSATNASSAGAVDLTFDLLDSGTYAIAVGGADVNLTVAGSAYAQINNIVLIGGEDSYDLDLVDMDVADLWNTNGTLVIDASGLTDVSDDDTVGAYDAGSGLNLDGTAEDDAVLDVTGSDNDDTIVLAGKTDVGDTVVGMAGDDYIRAGIGNDTLTGDDGVSAQGSDWFAFEATGSANGLDSITDFTVGARDNSSYGDVLDFSLFFAAAYGTFDMASAENAGAAAADDLDHLFVATDSTGTIDATSLVIGVDNGSATATKDDIAGMFLNGGTSNYLDIASAGKAVIIFGDHNGSDQEVQVFVVDAGLNGGGDPAEVDSTEVFLVGTLNAQDLDSFLAANFGML